MRDGLYVLGLHPKISEFQVLSISWSPRVHTQSHLQVFIHHVADAHSWDHLHKVRRQTPVKPKRSLYLQNVFEQSPHGHFRSTLH